MTKGLLLLTISLFCYFVHFFGQDTLVYAQQNQAMFSNYYTFYKKSASDNFGTFIHYSKTDDAQSWYGKGTFTETAKKYVLTFDYSNCHNRTYSFSVSNHPDTLYIKWFNWYGVQEEWFTIHNLDNPKKNVIYQVEVHSDCVKIPISEITCNHLSLFPFGSDRNILEFEVIQGTDEIHLYANDPEFMHTFDKTKETLKKNKKGFKTIGMWTNEKPTQFIRIQQ